MQEIWGDRSTLIKATQMTMRNMVSWGVLSDTNKKSVCTLTDKPVNISGDLAKLLLESVLIHESKLLSVEQLLKHPSVFPFKLVLDVHNLRESPYFEVYRQGMDVDVVTLAKES